MPRWRDSSNDAIGSETPPLVRLSEVDRALDAAPDRWPVSGLGSITDVTGIRCGHWTGDGTGVTVVLAPRGTVGSGEVRGGAPATRETDLLAPGRLVEHVDAVVLSGGSAFGLAAADGVVRFLAERGQGFATSGGPVPIVVGACIFDLRDPSSARPTPADGYDAAVAAELGAVPAVGLVGAGRGATVSKWRGSDAMLPGGFGMAARREGDLIVGAVAVVNAVGDVVGDPRIHVVGAPDRSLSGLRPLEHTTLVVVATNARLDRPGAFLLAQSGHDGMARALDPVHTRFDGDTVFTLATGAVEIDVDTVRRLGADVVAKAIRSVAG